MTAAEQIHRWKAEKNCGDSGTLCQTEIQEIADYVGDSFFSAKKAAELDAGDHRALRCFFLWERARRF